MSDFEVITVDKYTKLQLDEYNGAYKIVEGWIKNDGTFSPNFCKREFGGRDNRQEKTAPVSVKLGDMETAVETLKQLLYHLTGDQYAPLINQKLAPDEVDESVPL